MLYFWWGCRGNVKLITLGSDVKSGVQILPRTFSIPKGMEEKKLVVQGWQILELTRPTAWLNFPCFVPLGQVQNSYSQVKLMCRLLEGLARILRDFFLPWDGVNSHLVLRFSFHASFPMVVKSPCLPCNDVDNWWWQSSWYNLILTEQCRHGSMCGVLFYFSACSFHCPCHFVLNFSQARERRDGENPDYQVTDTLSTTANYRAVGPTAEASWVMVLFLPCWQGLGPFHNVECYCHCVGTQQLNAEGWLSRRVSSWVVTWSIHI